MNPVIQSVTSRIINSVHQHRRHWKSAAPPSRIQYSMSGSTVGTPIDDTAAPHHDQEEKAASVGSGGGSPVVASAAAAAAAAAPASDPDFVLAQRYQALEHLDAMGFGAHTALPIMEELDTADVQLVYNVILDRGLATDRGGSVVPIDNCPHVGAFQNVDAMKVPDNVHLLACAFVPTTGKTGDGGLKGDTTTEPCCSTRENWWCLSCHDVFCSRYVHGHSLDHWHATKNDSDEHDAAGHCVLVSLTDHSVWCHACQSYVRHDSLDPLLRHLEGIKFGGNNNGNTAAATITTPRSPSSSFREQQGMQKRAKSSHPNSEDGDSTIDNNDQAEVEAALYGSTRATVADDNDDVGTKSKGAPISADHNNGATSSSSADSSDDAPSIPHRLGSDRDESEDDDDDDPMVRTLLAAAAAQGIPIEFLAQLRQMGSYDSGDDDDVTYPFAHPPTSLDDVAQFIQSDQCRKIVVLSGAGISVASGIPDYRSANGLYATLNASQLTATDEQRWQIQLDPAAALEQPLFLQNPLPTLEVKREFILGTQSRRWKATLAHRFCELLHLKTGKLARIYTQNIDGLEDQTLLPRDRIIPVHGSMDRAECAVCGTEMDFDDFCHQVRAQIKDITGRDPDAPSESSPIECPTCGCGAVKPAIVLFKSSLPRTFYEKLPEDMQDVDLLLIMGTSLRVAPANSLVYRVPRHAMRVLINRESVGWHLGMNFEAGKRDYWARGDCDAVCLELMDKLQWLDDLQPHVDAGRLPAASQALIQSKTTSATN